MNTKLLNKDLQQIQIEFDDIFSFESEKDQIENDAHLLMAKFLSEVQMIIDEKGIKRKELASKIGTSASYLTQLFRGHKLINLLTIAKLQRALDIKFEIDLENSIDSTKPINDENIGEHLDKWFTNRKSGDYFKLVRNFSIEKSEKTGYDYNLSTHSIKKFA